MGCNVSTDSRTNTTASGNHPTEGDNKRQTSDNTNMAAGNDDSQKESGEKFKEVLMKNLMAIEGG